MNRKDPEKEGRYFVLITCSSVLVEDTIVIKTKAQSFFFFFFLERKKIFFVYGTFKVLDSRLIRGCMCQEYL